MEKQVQVKIQWKKNSAIISNELGLKWSFKFPKSSAEQNLASVSTLASSLLAVTIQRWCERSISDSVCFTLKAEDII